MKIGIITLLGNNYGNRLQNFAVSELLKKYGEVYTVKYEKKTAEQQNKSKLKKLSPFYIKEAVESRLLNIYFLRNKKKNVFLRAVYFLKNKEKIKKAILKRDAEFKKFDEKYIRYEEEKLHLAGDDREPWVASYDAWVAGSDQIWNPKYPTATRNAFLQFANEERRISLAASIGLSNANEMPESYAKWIGEIPYISVREEAAADIVKKLTGKNAEVLLDPTMLIPEKTWEEMAENTEVNLPENFALCYFLGECEKEYRKVIDNYLKEHDLKAVELLSGEQSEYLSMPPNEMVAAVKKAKIVFVDSFHGAVFSILFRKPFVVFERRETGMSMNSRLQTLLKKFELEDRFFNSANLSVLEKPVDYSKTEKILFAERAKATAFLDNAMENILHLEKESANSDDKMIKLTKKEHCFGCNACAESCPKKCIIMKEDEEGFLYPEIDLKSCVNCGKCKSVCPYYNRELSEIKTVTAAINKNEKIRSASSSGGVFYELAKSVIDEGGVVFGCAWNEKGEAVHVKIENNEDLCLLSGSKYVQSNVTGCYLKVKEELLAGCRVLFSGTPCQVSGLKNYLGKEYNSLLTVDVLCHGVPSPKVMREYRKAVEKKFGSKITFMNVRDKKKSWHRLHTEMHFENGSRYYVFCGYDTYMSMFLTNMSQRPSCFECKFTSSKRSGDITLGDFWGIALLKSEMDDDKGTSMVAVNTQKGFEAFNKVQSKFKTAQMSFEAAEAGNKVLSVPPKKNKNRDLFYKDFIQEGYEAAAKKWVTIPSKPKQLYYDLMRKGLDFYRLIFNKKY